MRKTAKEWFFFISLKHKFIEMFTYATKFRPADHNTNSKFTNDLGEVPNVSED